MIHSKKQIKDLEEELQDQNQQYLEAIKDRDVGAEKLRNAKESMGRFDDLVKVQADKVIAVDREQKEKLEKKLADKETEIVMLKQSKEHLEKKVEELQERLQEYKHIQ